MASPERQRAAEVPEMRGLRGQGGVCQMPDRDSMCRRPCATGTPAMALAERGSIGGGGKEVSGRVTCRRTRVVEFRWEGH